MAVMLNFPAYISTDGIDTSDATATSAQILQDYTAYVNGNKITGAIPSKAAEIITPTTTNQTINLGQYLAGNQTIVGDPDLISENIAGGISIFGVNGNPMVLNTKALDGEAAASASNMEIGRVAYIDGMKIVGNVEVLTPGSNDEPYTITPSAADQVIASMSEKKYIKFGLVVEGDENLIAENIKEGVSIFGIVGTHQGGETINTENVLMDTSSMTTAIEVYNEYSSIIQVANDGTTFAPLPETGTYEIIYPTYIYNMASISLPTGRSPVGFYFTTPISITSLNTLLKLRYWVSSWVNPILSVHFISAASVDEITTKIINSDYAHTQTVSLVNVANLQNNYYEIDIPLIGEYYIYLEAASNLGGNECYIGTVSVLSI